MQDQEAKIIISLCCKLQSVVHDIDELSDAVIFKHDLKQKTNSYLKFIEKKLDFLGRAFDEDEGAYFISIVKEIDKIGKSIRLEQSEKVPENQTNIFQQGA